MSKKITLASVLANPQAHGIDLPRKALDQLTAEYTALEQAVAAGRIALRYVDTASHIKLPRLVEEADEAVAKLKAIQNH